MLKNIFVVTVLLYGILIHLTIAMASTIIPMNHREMTTEAELIFVGTVANLESKVKANNTIYTEVTFTDLQIVKGIHPGETLIVELAGGTIGQYHSKTVGMPEFQVGGRHLIFLAGNRKHLCPIVGWSQGKFNIVINQMSGREDILDNYNNPIKEIKDNEVVRQTAPVDKRGKDFPGISPEHGIVSQQLSAGFDDGKRLSLREFISITERLLGLN